VKGMFEGGRFQCAIIKVIHARGISAMLIWQYGGLEVPSVAYQQQRYAQHKRIYTQRMLCNNIINLANSMCYKIHPFAAMVS
jgi:hypothetical protein